MAEEISRLTRLEVTVSQHAELLRRAVIAMEQQAVINERLAIHLEEGKRVWDEMESVERRVGDLRGKLDEAQTRLNELANVVHLVKKLLWWLLPLAAGLVVFLSKYWLADHGLL
ncbi:MAG TPA: hypothetical protein PLU26_02230 [Candidatus Competibacter sp.]|nr:hypothetical protein [Candidatus Competibacteraceae bacterium]HUM93281.1 hypothetical protein [Candidatus Competibacter sp.]